MKDQTAVSVAGLLPLPWPGCNGWTEEVYRDLLALQEGSISHDALDAKYLYRRAILTLDLTGFTVQAMKDRPLNALLRILDAQKVCIPVLHEHGALLVRAFADDLVGLFEEPGRALDAAFEIHRRVTAFNHSAHAVGTIRRSPASASATARCTRSVPTWRWATK